MNTKSHDPIVTPTPTVGEVFEFCFSQPDLAALGAALNDLEGTSRSKRENLKTLSDMLMDWAREPEGRVPTVAELRDQLEKELAASDEGKALSGIFWSAFLRILQVHRQLALSTEAFLERATMRSWYARNIAPNALLHLRHLHLMLGHWAKFEGPILSVEFSKVLELTLDSGEAKHPLITHCFEHALFKPGPHSPTTGEVGRWHRGKVQPKYAELAKYLRGSSKQAVALVNVAFALIVEACVRHFMHAVGDSVQASLCKCLLKQAKVFDRKIGPNESQRMDLLQLASEDLDRKFSDLYENFFQGMKAERDGLGELDLRVLEYRPFDEYQEVATSDARIDIDPELVARLSAMVHASQLHRFECDPQDLLEDIKLIRTEAKFFAERIECILSALEARAKLVSLESPTEGDLMEVLRHYRKAADAARYRAGDHAIWIVQEALGLACLLKRADLANGESLKPWINKTLAWWDLMAMGNEFDHPDEDRRIERAEHAFVDGLSSELRERLYTGLKLQALEHHRTFVFVAASPEAMERRKEPIDKRQRQTMVSSVVGREQTPLMEAIDRRQLDVAVHLVKSGADLNFLNSTGDNCVTKAFAANAYSLILEILRREQAPIQLRTLQYRTVQHNVSAVELAVCHGDVEILRELSMWRRDRGGMVDWSADRVRGVQTALYYATMLKAHWTMDEVALVRYMENAEVDSPVAALARNAMLKPTLVSRASKTIAEIRRSGSYEQLGIGRPSQCDAVVDYLLQEARVDPDLVCNKGFTALVLAAEHSLTGVALKLLEAGANVNHQAARGATALCWAVRNNNVELARLLLEYRADPRIFVEEDGRPIYTMEMSESMRQLIPYRM